MLSNAVTNIDSVTTYKQYVARAKECGMTALAFTEHGNIFEWVHKKEAIEASGMKYIHAMEGYLTEKLPAEDEEKIRDNYHCVLIAKNYEGVKELNRLASRAFNRNDGHYYYAPRITFDELFATSDNIIVNSACFTAGNKVKTSYGEKNIEDIKCGDIVLNQNGEWEVVNFPTQTNYSDVLYDVRCIGDYRRIKCTKDHKFLTISSNHKEPKWTTIEEIEKSNTSSGSKRCFLYPINLKYTNNTIIYKKDWDGSYKQRKILNKKNGILPDEIITSNSFMRMIGLFLGDGHITLKKRPCIGFTLNYNEFDNCYNSCIKIVENELGIKFNIRKRKESNRVDVVSANLDLINLFYWLFNDEKAETKRVPGVLKHISKELDEELLFGYLMSDGHFRNSKIRNYESGRITISSVSELLLRDIMEIFSELEIKSSIITAKPWTGKDGTNHKRSFYCDARIKAEQRNFKKDYFSHEDVVSFFNKHIDNKGRFIKINDITYEKKYIREIKKEKYTGTVYCLNNNSHSFICNGVIAHNCVASPLGRGTDSAKEKFIEFLKKNKHRCFLEVQHHNTEKQYIYNKYLVRLSKEIGVPLVAATDTHCLNEEHAMGRVALQNGKGVYFDGEEGWDLTWKTYDELIEAFKLQGALTENEYMSAIQNTNLIADMVEPFDLDKKFKFPKIYDNGEEILHNKLFDEKIIQSIVDEGKKENQNPQKDPDGNEIPVYTYTREDVINRLNTEMETFKAIDSDDYILLVDYITQYAHSHDMWQGPARGSAASSLALYALGVTEVNPLKYGFYFWRFMDKAKYSLPD